MDLIIRGDCDILFLASKWRTGTSSEPALLLGQRKPEFHDYLTAIRSKRRFSMEKIAKLVTVLAMVFLAACLVLGSALPALADDSGPLKITDTPTVTPSVTPPPPPVVPEASSLILLGSSAAGLAAYVGLQVRARRRRP